LRARHGRVGAFTRRRFGLGSRRRNGDNLRAILHAILMRVVLMRTVRFRDDRRRPLRRSARNMLFDQLPHAGIARAIRSSAQHDRDDVLFVAAHSVMIFVSDAG
jgi:hypothetical protein